MLCIVLVLGLCSGRLQRLQWFAFRCHSLVQLIISKKEPYDAKYFGLSFEAVINTTARNSSWNQGEHKSRRQQKSSCFFLLHRRSLPPPVKQLLCTSVSLWSLYFRPVLSCDLHGRTNHTTPKPPHPHQHTV